MLDRMQEFSIINYKIAKFLLLAQTGGVPINDIGTDESAHLEIISQSGIPNGEIIAATQSTSICYATRYAIVPMKTF